MSSPYAEELVYRPGASLNAPQSRYPGFSPGQTILKAGTVIKKGALPLAQDLTFDRDVAVVTRDGIKLYVNIYRPVNVEGLLPAIIALSPYGKFEGYMTFDDYPYRGGVPQRLLSGLDKFEGPDPVWWCARGYAVVNPDPRGAYRSGGNLAIWDRQEGEDGYDLVEWLAVQKWCNGKVGMAGTSWLAIAQWFTAAERPPHLAAIAPWEGLADAWSYTFFDGGIPDATFITWLMRDAASEAGIEDIAAMLKRYPEHNEHWARKRAAVENINIPVYAAMSWGGKLHCKGFFDAWHRLKTKEKWLRVGVDLEWPGFYENRYQHDLLRFFDQFLKSEETGWFATPPVRLTVVDFADRDIIDRAEAEFPVSRSRLVDLYLNAVDGGLGQEVMPASIVSYDAETGSTQFDFTFGQPCEINGYPEVHLFVEAAGSDDADVFVKLVKLSPDGEPQIRLLIPKKEPEFEHEWDAIAAVSAGEARSLYAYDGSWGRLRASRRAITTDPREAPHYPPEERLAPGQIVEIKLTMSPTAMAVRAGETIRLMIAGHSLVPLVLPGIEKLELRNAGRHIVHTGGNQPSRLILPIIGPGVREVTALPRRRQ
jgi:uncharacterized protein